MGSMKKLNFHAAAKDMPEAEFQTFDGAPATLETYEGKHVVLNFWATWCAPCRKEMPMLQELQAEFGGENFAVVTIATGRNNPAAMRKFFADIAVENLPLYRDPKQIMSRQIGVLGLPATLILDPQGREIARMVGDAEWNSPSAKAMISALLTP
jgi:thiol-disulfide isomerase/thioredoxin